MNQESINYMQTIPNSQFYSEIDMIINSLKHIRIYLSEETPMSKEVGNVTRIELQSPRSRLDYILMGLENTKKQGYKLINKSENE